MNEILNRANELKEEIIGWRRYIHAHAEVGFKLPETVAFVTDALINMGYAPVTVCESGIVAVLNGGREGKCVLLRADMDALPMEEKSGLPFASNNHGKAHTCGHDTHTAMLLGAAKILMEHRERIKGCIKLVFQPGEELGKGALAMIEKGVLENPHVDMVFGIHQIVGRPGIHTGEIAYTQGPAMASADLFKITAYGKGGHGAAPESGIDPINILAHTFMGLQTITSRERPSLSPVVLTIGQFAAGDAPNIIPHSGYMTGSLRTFDQEVRESIKSRIKDIGEKTAAVFGGRSEVEFMTGMAPLVNDAGVTKELAGYMADAFGKEKLKEIPPVMGSEDFSYFLLERPGAFFRVSLGSVEEGYTNISHHPQVQFNEEGLPMGAAVYVVAAMWWLENH